MFEAIKIQILFLFLGTVVLLASDTKQCALSYFLGAGLILINLILLTWIWGLVLKKKLIALSVMIIVFKYALFGLIIYFVLQNSDINGGWFSVGISTVVATSVTYAFLKHEKVNTENINKENESIKE